jgi:predicted RNA binding protein YcfA (HicA-like mRNA interferase family)
MRVRDIISLIEQDGWVLVATKGSHRQYKHPAKSGRVTIAGHPGLDLAKGTLNSIYKQAQVKKGRK